MKIWQTTITSRQVGCFSSLEGFPGCNPVEILASPGKHIDVCLPMDGCCPINGCHPIDPVRSYLQFQLKAQRSTEETLDLLVLHSPWDDGWTLSIPKDGCCLPMDGCCPMNSCRPIDLERCHSRFQLKTVHSTEETLDPLALHSPWDDCWRLSLRHVSRYVVLRYLSRSVRSLELILIFIHR